MSTRQVSRKESSRTSFKFTNAADIRRALEAKDEHGLAEGLTALRNQLTVKNDEPTLSVSDDRLRLVQAWLETSAGAGDLFAIWEATNSRQTSVLVPLIGVLSALLTLLSPHYLYHAPAQPIISNLLLPQWAHRLNTYLSGANNELILVSLKLFYSLSCFANGRERKSLFEVFAWEAKSLPKLLHMRRKGQTDDGLDLVLRPDIRTLFVLLLLSFVDAATPASVKSAFLEQRKDIFSSTFRGLWQDPYTVVRRVLEVCWVGVWSDPKVKRTLKVQVFNETVLAQLLRVYERDSPEDDIADRVPADVVHHFLLAICTRPGVGICFKDNGWYPRDVASEDSGFEARGEASGSKKQSRINNKILANILKTLKVNDDPRQQELALKILSSCPELVAGYWPAAALTLEPRLSSKWIANIAFFGQVISLPIPVSSFQLLPSVASSSSTTPQYNPTPPPLSSLTENILPAVNIKVHLSRGLQAPSLLVRHCTALALAKCLLKYDAVLRTLLNIERALEEDADGQWTRRRIELEREIRRRVPEFQVVLGFAQKSTEAARANANADGDVDVTDKNPVRGALLAESAQRLLWLYHRCVPALVAEARFDVGKLLLSLQHVLERPAAAASAQTDGLDTLRQFHVLRLLDESDQFNWSGKAGGSHSNLYILLKMYAVTQSMAIRSATAVLLQHSLSSSLLFQHDPDELVLWLRSLPSTARPVDAQAPDGTSLTDERDAVISFLDECAQLCAKIPYRFLEELRSLASEGKVEDVDIDGGDHGAGVADNKTLPSPLLITISEQLIAKLKGKHLSPSSALAVIAFVRKLVCHLISKTCQLDWLVSYVRRLRRDAFPLAVFPEHHSITSACKSEAEHLEWYFPQDRSSTSGLERQSDRVLAERITQLEEASNPATEPERQSLVSSLVDSYRFAQQPISVDQLTKLISIIENVHKPTLRALFEYMRPDQHCLWELLDVPTLYPNLQDELTYDVLLAHCGASHIEDPATREVLASSLVSKSSSLSDVERGAVLIDHRLHIYVNEEEDCRAKAVLSLLAHVIGNAKSKFGPDDYKRLVAHVFDMDTVKRLCEQSLSADLRRGLGSLLSCVPKDSTDSHNVTGGFARFWMIKATLDELTEDEIETTRLWIPFADTSDLLTPLDHYANVSSLGLQRVNLAEDMLRAIARDTSVIQLKPTTIASLHSIAPASKPLESVLGTLLHDRMPLCYDGLVPSTETTDMRTLVEESARRWRQSTTRSDSFVAIDEVLQSQRWSDATADIVVSLVYREPSTRGPVLDWLKGDVSALCTTPHLARVLYALVDCGTLATASQDDLASLVPLYRRVLRGLARGKNAEGTGRLCTSYVRTACAMTEQLSPIRGQLLAALEKECEKTSSDATPVHFIRVVASLSSGVRTEMAEVSEELLSKALPWVAQILSSGEKLTLAEVDALTDLSVLARIAPPRAHLVETILNVIPQRRLGDVAAISFARALVQATSLKPFVINKLLQNIVQHPQLYALAGQNTPVRDALADLLLVLFRLHPSNTCQPTHVEPLLRVYGGSLSRFDTKILAIFRLFESVRKTSCSTLLSRWSASPTGSMSNALDAILSLDPNRVLKTSLDFPQRRRFSDDVDLWETLDTIYDPVFVILLFAQVLASCPPSSALSWIQLFRTNVVSLLIRTASAKDEHTRSIAMAQLAALHKTLQDVDMQEQPHVLYILNLLKDALVEAPRENVPRLPTFTTSILAHALRAVFYPSNFIYPLTARFLLQRPKLDTGDVPMLFSMLYSSSEQWKKERGWVVRFLSDAMVGSDEWRVMQRRHTWDLLVSLYQSGERDKAIRRGILEVLANITCNARATTSLILKSALLSWIEMQLGDMKEGEPLAWAKILANIVSVVDPAKIEAATNGEWRLTYGRCLSAILTSPACSTSVLPYATELLLRVVILPGSPSVDTNRVVQSCVQWLQKMQEDIETLSDLSLPNSEWGQCDSRVLPPYSSRGLFDHDRKDAITEWGGCVERLWRVCISRHEKCPEWDALTHRLLVWNAINSGRTKVGEWARKEAIQCLGSVH